MPIWKKSKNKENRNYDENENANVNFRKTQTERRGASTFTTKIEVLGYNACRAHMNTAESVDALLEERQPPTQLRWKTPDGRFMARFEGDAQRIKAVHF